MVECDGCGRTDDFVPSLAVCRRRYENVCPECMDVLEDALKNQRIRLNQGEKDLRGGIGLLNDSGGADTDE